LLTVVTVMPASRRTVAVPWVAQRTKPIADSDEPSAATPALSGSRTLMKTCPFIGRMPPAPACALAAPSFINKAA